MENKFNIDNDERNRILSLHESSTKQQYLNVLTEQATPTTPVTYTLGNTVSLENVKDKKQPEVKIFKGAVFQLANNQMVTTATIQFVDTLTGEVVTGPANWNTVPKEQFKNYTFKTKVSYDCKTYKFTTDKSAATQYFDENNSLGKILQSKCKTSQQGASNFKALYTIANAHNLGKVTVNVKDIIIKSTKYPDYAAIMRGNKPITYFNCKTNSWGDVQVTDTKGLLTKTIKEKVCPQITKTPATNTQTVGGKVGGKVVIPKDIDLSQMIQNLPPEIKTMITPQTIDGQPNTQGQPDFNQLLTQLQGLS